MNREARWDGDTLSSARLRREDRASFLDREWPSILQRMRRLQIDPDMLLKRAAS